MYLLVRKDSIKQWYELQKALLVKSNGSILHLYSALRPRQHFNISGLVPVTIL